MMVGMDDRAQTVSPPRTEPEKRVEAVRRFNRVYTQRIGVLRDGYLGSEFSLTQVRVLYELAHRQQPTASEIGRDLGLDAGYLSRIVRGFARRGLLETTPATGDGRQRLLSLTAGAARSSRRWRRHRAADRGRAGRAIRPEQGRLVAAMATITALLDAPADRRAPSRAAAAGGRHGLGRAAARRALRAEYGWDETFEALVAEIVAGFARGVDPERERCWIAERDGQRVGSIFLVQHPERAGVAKLRLLLVEPAARGLGVGRRLVDECVRFAREAGYHTITLWTNSVLVSARRIYEAAGFRLVHEEPHHSFGHDLVEQTWELRG